MTRSKGSAKIKGTVGLFYRADLTQSKVRFFCEILQKLGLSVKCVSVQHDHSVAPSKGPRSPQGLKFAISLGGDGTYLRVFHCLSDAKIPILGFHMGHLGFLTPFQIEEFEEVVTLYLSNQLSKQPRAILGLNYLRNGKILHQARAINDVVLERGLQTRLITTRVYMGKQLVNDIRADGLIVSTALGSTAYNLAAGGPILHPEVKGLVLCAISPHSIANRPLVLPENKEIRLSLVGEPSAQALPRKASKGAGSNNSQRVGHKMGRLVLDGVILDEIRAGDEVRLKIEKPQHWVFHKSAHDEFALMREKIRFGDNWILKKK